LQLSMYSPRSDHFGAGMTVSYARCAFKSSRTLSSLLCVIHQRLQTARLTPVVFTD
jgi:hypothetical protein